MPSRAANNAASSSNKSSAAATVALAEAILAGLNLYWLFAMLTWAGHSAYVLALTCEPLPVLVVFVCYAAGFSTEVWRDLGMRPDGLLFAHVGR